MLPSHATQFRLRLYPGDFDASRTFYADVLGYPVVEEWNDGPASHGAMFETGAGIIELLCSTRIIGPARGAGVSLEVADVAALWERLGTSAPVAYPLRHNAWGDTSFGLHDPDGFEVVFFARD
jgi:catechol 2,3-dioxygenase-like lactoylglutathione lyase family enzyme